MNPRDTLAETRANGQLRQEFFSKYVEAYSIGGDDLTVGSAYEIFEDPIIVKLISRLDEQALETEVILTDNLSNRLFGAQITLRSGDRFILINFRFKADAEMLAHTLVEEYAHVQ